jgi:hypothetical protein
MAPDFRLIAIQPQPLNRWGGIFADLYPMHPLLTQLMPWMHAAKIISCWAFDADRTDDEGL